VGIPAVREGPLPLTFAAGGLVDWECGGIMSGTVEEEGGTMIGGEPVR
jgi:hypothetical protein